MPPSVPAVDVDELRGREIARQQDAAGWNLEARRLRAIERDQHLALEIEQIVDAFGETRVAGGLQALSATRAGSSATRNPRSCLRPWISRAASDDLRIVEQLEVCRHDLAHSGQRGRRELGEARAHGVARTIERALLHIDALPGFDDGHLGRL